MPTCDEMSELLKTFTAKPHNWVGSIQDLRTGGRWFDSRHCQYSFRGLIEVHSSLTAVHCFDNRYVGKQPVAWKELCVKYWLKEPQESMVRRTGHHNISNSIICLEFQSINRKNTVDNFHFQINKIGISKCIQQVYFLFCVELVFVTNQHHVGDGVDTRSGCTCYAI